MKLHILIIAKELLNPMRPVSPEVVDNDVNLLAARLVRHNIGQKRNEFLDRVAGYRRTNDIAS